MSTGMRVPRTSAKSRVPGLASGVDDIAHGDRMLDRRAEPARGDAAGRLAGLVEQRGARADRLAAVRLQADALLGRPGGNDRLQRVGADEAAGFAHRLGNRPHQPGARRIDLGRDVLAMQAKPGLEAQAVAGGKPDPHDAIVGEQLADQRARVGFRQADLETVLAGIARAAHEPARLRLDAVHEQQRAGLDAGPRQRCPGFRPLDRQEHAVERLDLAVEAGGERAQMRFVLGGVAGIGDDHEALVAEPRDDEVVDDAGLLVEEEGVFRLRRSPARPRRAGRPWRSGRRHPARTLRTAAYARCRTGRHARGHAGAPS